MMKVFLYLTLVTATVCFQSEAHAYTGECLMPDGNTSSLTVNLSEFNVTDPSVNVPGAVVVKDHQFNASGFPYHAICDNDPNSMTPIFLTTKVPLTEVGSGWFKLNEYFSVKTQTLVNGHRHVYIDNPMKSESNEYNERNGTLTEWKTGGKGNVSIRIDRPFIGFSSFSKEIIDIYSNTFKDGISRKPLAVVYMSGSVIVPQNCELNDGQEIILDFGNIAASAFSEAGAGQRPVGVNPKTTSIGIKCKNVDAQALLTLRIEANKVFENTIVSDNPDLGFVVADGKQNILTPNTIDSNIPFKLIDGTTRVSISAWPVSVTGDKPVEGKFTSEGYLRVDFD